MDTEQQIRLNFLDEAEEYFDRIESNLLGLSDTAVDPEKIDLVLRSAHSIKGGAAMMGLNTLSHIAHRLEDFFKILRVRYAANSVDVEVETLLLQSVDCIRHLGSLDRQELSGLSSEATQQQKEAIGDRIEPIFERLQEHLGDLQASDENALLAQDEDVNPALLIFEEGVDEILDRFEEQLPSFEVASLSEELITTAQELMGFGNMAGLDSFTQLCESIAQNAHSLASAEMPKLTDESVKIWRRSHALVSRGSLDKLPNCLENFPSNTTSTLKYEDSVPDLAADITAEIANLAQFSESLPTEDEPFLDDAVDFTELQSAFAPEIPEQDDAVESSFTFPENEESNLDGLRSAFDSELVEDSAFDALAENDLNLDGLQSAFDADPQALDDSTDSAFDALADVSLDLSQLQSAFDTDPEALDDSTDSAFDALADVSLDLSQLQSAFDTDPEALDDSTDSAFDALADDSLDLSQLQSAFNLEQTDSANLKPESKSIDESAPQPEVVPKAIEIKAAKVNPTPVPSKASLSVEQMVRVPASQLKQFNSLFEQLVLNRNNINVKLQQFQNIIALMSRRISQMEVSNAQLKQWYDKASVEGVLTASDSFSTEASLQKNIHDNDSASNPTELDMRLETHSSTAKLDFDSLEMDRYSDIHLICQEQIETIVQLQEVATDIELGLQEINQATRELNYTTKSMQGNVTRTQMQPFATAIGRFPRVIRDLNLQYNKQVNLKVIGENTLLDRSFIKALGDPLMHLLRNAFDHGIEDVETRVAAGKSPSGTITIQASNQGTYTVINISDDGGGIPVSKIRDRLVKMGFSYAEIDRIPEPELLDFIFDPGFSTAKKVTELSGRGVGMDVVRTNLQEIRGDVRVSTKLGQGTTFTLKVPFTLSILRVAIVEQEGIIFAIPINNIRELLPLDAEEVKNKGLGKYLIWNQKEIPLVEIDKSLFYHRSHSGMSLTGNPAIDRTMAIVIEDEDFSAALQISCFWHEQESTTRSIDSPVPLPAGIISSVVFGDGKVIPLVDPVLLIKECLNSGFKEKTVPLSNPQQFASTILVVDDSINVRRYLSLTLEKAGYQTEQAKDGREAVEKLIGGLAVDAVICDIEMPRLDGYGVLEEIKQRQEFSNLPIAMLTSRSNEKHRKLAMNLGASAYFSKPYNEQQLLEKLAEILQDSKSNSV